MLSRSLAAAGDRRGRACYQGFVDLGFLNAGFWEYMIRASGTLGDPNKLGAVAAFWTIGAMVLRAANAAPVVAASSVAGLVLGIAAVWLSGSRTGLAAVLSVCRSRLSKRCDGASSMLASSRRRPAARW